MRVISRAVWTKTTYVQGKTQEFVGECLGRNNINYQNLSQFLKVFLKVLRMVRTGMDFFLQKKERNISSAWLK